ncbi:MAG: TIGR02921 family PEP-CTERM protein [Cyanobacteria bacterium J06621_8]
MNKLQQFRNFSYQSIFWGWNLIFICVVYFGILPFIGIPLIVAVLNGTIPLDFGLTLLALIAVPIASIAYGLKYLREQPGELMRWFFGVEAPLVTWCLVRLFLIRELTLATGLILGTLLISIVAFAIEILQGYRANRPVFSWLQMIAHTLMLFTGVYLGTVLLFYAIPVAAHVLTWISNFIIAFFAFDWVEDLVRSLSHGSDAFWFFTIFSLFSILFGFSAVLFVGMPLVLTNLLIKSGKKVIQAFAQQHSQSRAMQVSAVVVASWLILFNFFNQQPQVAAFKLLEQSPLNKTELLAAAPKIRQGLVNANLYPYRYLSTRSGNDHIFRMYDRLNLPESVSHFFQNRYSQLLSPFLYQGSQGDVDQAAQLYAEFFDTPIQKGERQAVRHALQSTAIVDQAKAGLLNIDQKKVWLAQQEVKVKPHGDWADVTIHEVYENQTPDVEEILYYFSLPESAAITGLWLGESDDLEQRFVHQVSPRGAAQEVYNSQVRRTRPVDPALLEQVGAGQYRLRAFPVPPKRRIRRNEDQETNPQMHLWLTYQVMRQEEGWAMPQLAEKRNIFWTGFTKRIRNGETKRFFKDVWFEDFAPESSQRDRENHQIVLDNSYTVTAQPLTSNDYALPLDQKYALILDTSYSMGQQVSELQSTFNWVQDSLAGNQADLYVTDVEANNAQILTNISNFSPQQLTFYGSLQPEEMLRQFQALRGEDNYDAVLLLTDRGSYELSKDKAEIPKLEAPLWIIHLGGKLPRAYNDQLLQVLQNTNGGVAINIATVMKRLATEAAGGGAVIDGYSWKVSPSDSEEAKATIDSQSLKAIAARQSVSAIARSNKHQLSLTELDTVHQIAKNNDIVTPYSSMIVLVNDRQREQLKAAEQRADRFEREVETGAEQLNTPFNPFETAEVSGVPEPDFWILLGLAILALSVIWQQQQKLRARS